MSRSARITIGILLVIWGVIGLSTVCRVPTAAQARWTEAKTEAKSRGEAPSTIPAPPVSERYTIPPQWIIAPVGIMLMGLLLVISARRSSGQTGARND